MDCVVDFVGYNITTGKTQKLDFVIKEFCIVRVKGNKVFQPVHHIIKQPFSWRKLFFYFQHQYTELINNIHGLDWADGDVSIKEAREIISSKLEKARSIYVLRESQIRDLNRFARTSYSIISLDQLGFKLPENILTLKTLSKKTMSHHVVKTAMFTAHLLSRQRLPLTIGSLSRNLLKMHLTDNDIEKINKQIKGFFEKSLSISMIECKIINQPNGRVRVQMKNYVNSKYRYKNWVDMDNNENFPNMHFKIVKSKFSIPKAYLVSVDATGEKYELVSNDDCQKLWEMVELLKKKMDYERENIKNFPDVSDASSELDMAEEINEGRISPIDNDDDDWVPSGSNHWMESEEDGNSENEGPDVKSEIDIDYNGWTTLDDVKMEPGLSGWSPKVNRSLEAHKSPKSNRSSDYDHDYQHKKLRKALKGSQSLQSDRDGHDIRSSPRYDLNRASGSQRSVNRSNSLVELDQFEVIGLSNNSSPVHHEDDDLDSESDIIKLNFDIHKPYVESDPIQIISDDTSSESDFIIVDDDSPRLIGNSSDNEDWAIGHKGK